MCNELYVSLYPTLKPTTEGYIFHTCINNPAYTLYTGAEMLKGLSPDTIVSTICVFLTFGYDLEQIESENCKIKSTEKYNEYIEIDTKEKKDIRIGSIPFSGALDLHVQYMDYTVKQLQGLDTRIKHENFTSEQPYDHEYDTKTQILYVKI